MEMTDDRLTQIERRVRSIIAGQHKTIEETIRDCDYDECAWVYDFDSCVRHMLQDFGPDARVVFDADGGGRLSLGPGTSNPAAWQTFDDAAPAICTAWCNIQKADGNDGFTPDSFIPSNQFMSLSRIGKPFLSENARKLNQIEPEANP